MAAIDLEADADRATALCVAAQARLLDRVAGLADSDVRRPSRLPGWSIGHLLSHLAMNADGHARRLSAALMGRDEPKYRGGPEQRTAEIEAGARLGAAALVRGLRESQERLEELFSRSADAGWPAPAPGEGSTYPASACPAHRLREVEMHHVDLGLGYRPEDWPADYVAWDLPNLLGTIPGRLVGEADRARFAAWLAGRTDFPSDVLIQPWG